MGKWFWGILILAIISLLVGMFLHSGAKTNPSAVGDSIRSALSNDHGWAKVDMDGHVAKLSGEAPNQTSLDSAMALAKSTASGAVSKTKEGCEICKGKSKDFSVANNATIKAAAVVPPKPTVPTVSPYTFKATKLENGRVDLTGHVPSEEDRNRVYSEAEDLFGNRLRSKNVTIAAASIFPSLILWTAEHLR